MDLFGRRRRRQRRRHVNPSTQIGNAIGKGIATVLVGLVTSFLRRK